MNKPEWVGVLFDEAEDEYYTDIFNRYDYEKAYKIASQREPIGWLDSDGVAHYFKDEPKG